MAPMNGERWSGPHGEVSELPFAGQLVTQIRIDYALTFCFEDISTIRISQAIEFSRAGMPALVLQPETEQTLLGPVLAIVNTTVLDARVTRMGQLTMHFEEGRSVRVEPDDRYEAWEFSRKNNELLVALPGGTLAFWAAPKGR